MTQSIIIIGAGPAGLAAAAALKTRGFDPVVLEQANELAHTWKTHYDRLKLNSVKWLSHLPHLPMPASYPRYPSRAQIVSYLESYARHFNINPILSTRVLNITRSDNEWVVSSNQGDYKAAAVIIATGFNHKPRIPVIPGIATFQGEHIHSKEFRNGTRYKGKRVMVIGAGNSGSEIALDLMEHGASVSISIRSPTHITPLDLFGFLPVHVTSSLLNYLPLPVADFIAGTTLKLAVGNLSRYGITRPSKGPLRALVEDSKVAMFDTGIVKAIKNGRIQVMPAVNSVAGNTFSFSNGSTAEFDAVIYATGYDHDLGGILKSIIDNNTCADTLTKDGYPVFCGKDLGNSLYFTGFKESPRGMLADIRKQTMEIANSIHKKSVTPLHT